MSREYINEFNKPSRLAITKHGIKIMLVNALLKMKYRKKIKENNVFRNKYKGDTCFVIGNGPSLTIDDLNKIEDLQFVSFASNKIFKVFNDTHWRPDYYAVCDPVVFLRNKHEFKNLTFEKFIPLDLFLSNNLDSNDWHVFIRQYEVYPDRFRAFQPDLTKFLGEGWTVTYFLLQIAVFMGFKRICLLGCDFNYSYGIGIDGKFFNDSTVNNYFIKEDTTPATTPNLQYNYLAYKEARRFADANDIKIYNATRGGKLEVFERIDVDKIFLERQNMLNNNNK